MTRLTLASTSMAGKMAFVRQVAVEHDMSVQNAADGVGDRLVHIVAVHQHGVEAGDRSRSPVPARSSSFGSAANTEGV